MTELAASEEDLEVTSETEEVEFEPSFTADILELEHSFGYDCKRLYNLCLIDDDTLVFASGNFIHYFSISRREVTFRRTYYDAGIGFITKNEHPDHLGLLTIAENGPKPTVFIYEYPSHEVRIRLDGAAKTQFTCGSYNSSGELFASQAGYPDFMLTIWRWQTAEIILRSKSFQSDVLHVHFSHHNPILLVSCGLSHIKFWKMAHTFTGLKLQGDLGRFGKTDFSDIYAIYMLPDENVISGCEWGNMLLWEAGLIKFEVCRKGRRPCHTKPISRITMRDGEVMTVGMDGYVRIWFWETVDLADPPDDDRFVEIEPIYEFKVGNCEIRSLQKIKPFEERDYGYYAQDGNGGIWYCDLNTDDVPAESRKLYSCHGGQVIAAQTSPVSAHLMTLGADGKIFVFDYAAKSLVLEKSFASLGTDLLWFDTRISSSGMELVACFEDGVLRQLLLDTAARQLHLVSAVKAHTAPVTKLAINPSGTVLVTGSADKSIFLYRLTEKGANDLVKLVPMGFVKFDVTPNCFNWLHEGDSVILVGGIGGEVCECQLPLSVNAEQTFLTYNLTDTQLMLSTKFVSVKSRIRRDLRREQIKQRKAAKRQRKLDDIEKLKKANPGLQIDLETALADSEPEEEEPPLYIPPKPNAILWLRQTANDTIWASMGGYDAGYIYEMNFLQAEPVRSTIITDGDDCEINSYITIDDYLIFGLINGKLRINRTVATDFTDLRDYRLFSMHDSLKGNIPRLLLSCDGKYLFSIGHDGNIFSYRWHGPVVATTVPAEPAAQPTLDRVDDIDDPAYPSLEQEKIYAEIKRQEEAAAAHDRKVLGLIAELQVKFNDLQRRNEMLPSELQIQHRDMLLDERITQQIANELQAELDDVRDDLAYDLEVAQVGKTKLYNHFLKELDHIPILIRGIANDTCIYSFRMNKLGEVYEEMQRDIEERLRLEALKVAPAEPTLAEEKSDIMPEPGEEVFFFGRDPDSIIPRFSRKMLRLLTRYRGRQVYEIERIYNWERLDRRRPDPNRNHPDDDEKIRQAELSMGDYKLKIGADYEPKPTENFTHKYIEIAECYERHYEILSTFNRNLFDMRKHKQELYAYIAVKRERLDNIHKLLPAKNRMYLPQITPINYDEEVPENNLIEHCQPSCGVEIKDLLYLEHSTKDLMPKPPPPPKTSLSDIEAFAAKSNMPLLITAPPRSAELHLYKSLRVHELDYVPADSELIAELSKLPARTDPAYFECLAEEGCQGTMPWLKETRYVWLIQLLDEQYVIVRDVSARVKKFNEELEALYFERMQAKFDAEFMRCYMISLNQELFILRDSEQIENQLLSNAEAAMVTRNQMQKTINASNRLIDDCRKMCDKLNEHIAQKQAQFMATCKGHKFFDFLRRIFKKKWKAPKPPKLNDESSESSSSDESSSEEEDADTKSVDSTDMTAIRLDETHCPSGLERSTYELAFKLRSERHEMERALSEQQKIIEQRRQEVAELMKQMKYHEDVYAREKNTLLEFRRKRQQELNKVKVAVVLRMSQLQHFYDDEDYRDVSKAVLFDATRLSLLKSRVEQLNDDTQQTKRLHRINIVHLRRMNVDIKFMRGEIVRLESEIRETMMKKFGMVIDLDELEEEVLRKYVFELETTAEQELRLIELELRKKMNELAVYEEELIHETQVNANKLNVLAVLQEEKNYLEELLQAQENNYERWLKQPVLNLDRDIERLQIIDRQQKEQIKCLDREICTLRLKSKPLQLDTEPRAEVTKAAVNVADEAPLPQGESATCVRFDMFNQDAFNMRAQPDEFIMDRVYKIVLKCLLQLLTPEHLSKENVRKYAQKVARYLGQAAYNFQGELTDRILDCITEQLEQLMPKKYLIHLSGEHVRQLFQDILTVFDYERSEVNTEDVISGIFGNALETLAGERETSNKTQFVVECMFKELIEVLPLEEFQSETTLRSIVDTLQREPFVEPKCISIEGLIEVVVAHARANLLDGITAIPIRRLAESICRELVKRRQTGLSGRCSIGSVASVSISTKKK